jgi:hypothetical protein
MRVIFDAELIAGYFREAERGEPPAYTASTVPLVARLGSSDLAFVDDGGIIEQGYQDLVEVEWFEAWFGECLADGAIDIVPAASCPVLINLLADKFGFPKTSKDRHYVALAVTLVARHAEIIVLLSEDLDFYDPPAKARGSKARDAILRSCSGPLAKHLAKKQSVAVRSVAAHLAA